MKHVAKRKIHGNRWTSLSLMCYCVGFLGLCLAFWSESEVFSSCMAALFWFGILTGSGIQVRLNILRRRMSEKQKAGRSRKKAKPGIIAFSNKGTHLLIYAIFVCSVLLLAVDALLSCVSRFWFPVVFSAAALSFIFHCVVDGAQFSDEIDKNHIEFKR